METQIQISQLPVNPAEFGLEESKGNEMYSGLVPIVQERKSLESIYNQIITQELNDETLSQARELRLRIRDNRTKGIEKWHKTNKDFYLQGGRFVDAIKNKEIVLNELMESRLLEIEKHFERIEAERLQKLKSERLERLVEFGTDTQFVSVELMTDEQFEDFYNKQKSAHVAMLEQEKLAEIARVEAERKAEEERIAKEKKEAEEREAQRVEMERLKAESEAKEKQLAQERAKAEAERKAIEEKAAKEKAEQEAKLKAEQQERARVEAELQAKKQEEERLRLEAEAKKKAEELAAKKAAAAPDIDKMIAWVNSMGIPSIQIKDAELDLLRSEIETKFDLYKTWAVNLINSKTK